MRNDYKIRPRIGFKDGSFPDLNKDGKVTQADILKGRGVFKKGSRPLDMSKGHEGMESKAEEAKEYAMEEKGYVENKFGKMKKKKKYYAKRKKSFCKTV